MFINNSEKSVRKDKRKYSLFDDHTERWLDDNGAILTDKGLAGRQDKRYKECNWWQLQYRYEEYSIYFDKHEVLGYFGEPYYELYDGDETWRWSQHDNTGFINFLDERFKEHDKKVYENPELFL